MSYCYDVMSRAWATLREQLPPDVRDSETAVYFEFLINEMHEAAINHDDRVTRAARRLDQLKPTEDA